jgi:hypothetical protein
MLITPGMNFLPDQLKIGVAWGEKARKYKIIEKNAVSEQK